MTGRWGGHLGLAAELGQHLHQLMGWPGPMTHRQYAAWTAWRNEGWNRPDRSDHYAMQVACQVARVLARDQDKIKVSDFRLKFSDAAAPAAATDPGTSARHRANQMAWNKSKWLGAMRGSIEHRTISRAEAIERGFLGADTPHVVDMTG